MFEICKKCSCYYQQKDTWFEWIKLMMATIGLDPRKTTCFAGGGHLPSRTLVDIPHALGFPTPEFDQADFSPCRKCAVLCLRGHSNHGNCCPADSFNVHRLVPEGANFRVMKADGETHDRTCSRCGCLYNDATGDKRCVNGAYHSPGDSYVLKD